MTRLVAVALTTLGLAVPSARAADVSGVWLKDAKDASGRPLTDAKNPDPAKRSRPLVGTVIAIDFHPTAEDPERLVGTFYNAEDGNSYKGSIAAPKPDELAVTGCLLFFCQTQTWTRVKR